MRFEGTKGSAMGLRNALRTGTSTPNSPITRIEHVVHFGLLVVAFIGRTAPAMGDASPTGSLLPPSALDWTLVTGEAPWGPRLEHTSVVFDGRIWVIGGRGGFGSASFANDVWSSVDGENWSAATLSAPWSSRSGHSSTVFDGKIWVIGGGGQGGVLNDVWSSPDGETWTSATLSAQWEPRSNHTTVVYDEKLWVIGGSTASGPSTEVWSSTDGTSWVAATLLADWASDDRNAPGRSGHSSVVHDGKMWLIGGLSGNVDHDGNFFINDVWSSTDGAAWTQETALAPWGDRAEHTSVVQSGKMWILGHTNLPCECVEEFKSDVWYSEDGVQWTEATPMAPWTPRGWHSSVAFAGSIWIIGGIGFPPSGSDVWIASPPVNGALHWKGYP